MGAVPLFLGRGAAVLGRLRLMGCCMIDGANAIETCGRQNAAPTRVSRLIV